MMCIHLLALYFLFNFITEEHMIKSPKVDYVEIDFDTALKFHETNTPIYYKLEGLPYYDTESQSIIRPKDGYNQLNEKPIDDSMQLYSLREYVKVKEDYIHSVVMYDSSSDVINIFNHLREFIPASQAGIFSNYNNNIFVNMKDIEDLCAGVSAYTKDNKKIEIDFKDIKNEDTLNSFDGTYVYRIFVKLCSYKSVFIPRLSKYITFTDGLFMVNTKPTVTYQSCKDILLTYIRYEISQRLKWCKSSISELERKFYITNPKFVDLELESILAWCCTETTQHIEKIMYNDQWSVYTVSLIGPDKIKLVRGQDWRILQWEEQHGHKYH